jgi:hypothetical protein
LVAVTHPILIDTSKGASGILTGVRWQTDTGGREALWSLKRWEVEVTKFLTLTTTILVGSWIGVEAYGAFARVLFTFVDIIETATRAS